MDSKNYFFVLCVVSGVIFLAHLLRLLSGWTVRIENFSVPIWWSGVALVIMGYLSYESFRHWRSA